MRLLILCLVVVGIACSGRRADISAGAGAGVAHAPAQFTGAFMPAGSNVRGSVDVSSGVEPGKSRAIIQLRGARVGAEHGWQIRPGRCGEDAQAVGPAAAYRPVVVRADGTANLTTTVPVVLDPARDYYVVLLSSRTDLDGVIACGNLTVR